ncbi:hypothetical protein EAO73_35125 [Streptomyces sp. col6]|nr:hypothetical protein EAO73_35125 [Streptomyces sp. col6]
MTRITRKWASTPPFRSPCALLRHLTRPAFAHRPPLTGRRRAAGRCGRVRVRAAAAGMWRVRPVVDVALAAVPTVAVVYVMRGAFARQPQVANQGWARIPWVPMRRQMT